MKRVYDVEIEVKESGRWVFWSSFTTTAQHAREAIQKAERHASTGSLPRRARAVRLIADLDR